MKTIRIGNVELRIYNDGKNVCGEIVRYCPNSNYGDERTSTCRIKELCCTIAFVKNCECDEPDILTVGSRPFKSSDQDIQDFIKLCKLVYKEYWESDDANNEEE